MSSILIKKPLILFYKIMIFGYQKPSYFYLFSSWSFKKTAALWLFSKTYFRQQSWRRFLMRSIIKYLFFKISRNEIQPSPTNFHLYSFETFKGRYQTVLRVYFLSFTLVTFQFHISLFPASCIRCPEILCIIECLDHSSSKVEDHLAFLHCSWDMHLTGDHLWYKVSASQEDVTEIYIN